MSQNPTPILISAIRELATQGGRINDDTLAQLDELSGDESSVSSDSGQSLKDLQDHVDELDKDVADLLDWKEKNSGTKSSTSTSTKSSGGTKS